MAITDLFSKRQRKLRGEVPDVYVYDDLPYPLRVQITQIWGEVFSAIHYLAKDGFQFLTKRLQKEYGKYQLIDTIQWQHFNKEAIAQLELCNFFLGEEKIEIVLDVVELSFRYMVLCAQTQIAQDAITELNHRFKEHGIGYQFENDQIVRVDSELLHAEVVKPALRLLSQPGYAGPQQEFLKAHEHYRANDHEAALVECLKAFESMMKTICDRRGWAYDRQKSTAKDLIKILEDNGLFPAYLQGNIGTLRSLLESSIPTIRNKMAGHGQGSVPREVPDYWAAYMLHMTAATMVFLAALP
jgi:hypothetical protein